jgi:hypothetical protein
VDGVYLSLFEKGMHLKDAPKRMLSETYLKVLLRGNLEDLGECVSAMKREMYTKKGRLPEGVKCKEPEYGCDLATVEEEGDDEDDLQILFNDRPTSCHVGIE